MCINNPDDKSDAIVSHCSAHIENLLLRSPVYSHFLTGINIVSASKGCVIVRLTLLPLHLNSKGTLHGSVIATLVDFIGGLAIASWDFRDSTGVSTDMSVQFLSTVRGGETIDIEGNAEKVGGSLAFTTATIRKSPGEPGAGEVVAKGSHTKYVKQK